MEQENYLPDDENKMKLNDYALTKLDSIRKWTLFFAILGFVFMGFALLATIFSSAAFSEPEFQTGPMAQFGKYYFVMSLLVLVILLVIYFFPVLYLYKFSIKTRRAIRERSAVNFDDAFRYLNAHFKFVGILTIIFLALYGVFFLIVLLFGVFSSGGAGPIV